MHRSLVARAVTGTVLLVLLATACATGEPDGAPATSVKSPAFALRGRVRGLSPGIHTHITVRVRNLTARPLEIHRIVPRPADASRACPARYLKVRRFRGLHVVAPRSMVRLRLPVRLRRSAPDACQGARFPLSFRAKGEPA